MRSCRASTLVTMRSYGIATAAVAALTSSVRPCGSSYVLVDDADARPIASSTRMPGARGRRPRRRRAARARRRARADSARASVSAALRSAISSKCDDEAALERTARLRRAARARSGRGVAGGGARENTTAGREDRVRLVGDRLDDEIAADAVCLADPPDDDELGRRHRADRRYAVASSLDSATGTAAALQLASRGAPRGAP